MKYVSQLERQYPGRNNVGRIAALLTAAVATARSSVSSDAWSRSRPSIAATTAASARAELPVRSSAVTNGMLNALPMAFTVERPRALRRWLPRGFDRWRRAFPGCVSCASERFHQRWRGEQQLLCCGFTAPQAEELESRAGSGFRPRDARRLWMQRGVESFSGRRAPGGWLPTIHFSAFPSTRMPGRPRPGARAIWTSPCAEVVTTMRASEIPKGFAEPPPRQPDPATGGRA